MSVITQQSANQPPSRRPRLHDVYFTASGAPRFYWRNPNHGIVVGDGAITWMIDGQPHTARYGTIAAIHLQTAALGSAENVIDQCRIEFADGGALIVSNATATGLPQDAQTPIYRDFVCDLHRQLAAHGVLGIRFTAGMSPWRYKVLFITLITAALFFIGLPLVLLFVIGDPHVLIPMAIGAGLIWPLVRLMRNNAPRGYTPDALPDELLS
jgi:hypothetical protein